MRGIRSAVLRSPLLLLFHGGEKHGQGGRHGFQRTLRRGNRPITRYTTDIHPIRTELPAAHTSDPILDLHYISNIR
jgi:hypothetical protein